MFWKSKLKTQTKKSHIVLCRRCFFVDIPYLESSEPYMTEKKPLQNYEQLETPQVTALNSEDFLMKT